MKGVADIQESVRCHCTIFFCSRAFRSRKIPLTRSYWYTITANYYPSLIVFNSWKVFGRLFEIMGILYVQGVNMWVVCTRGRKGWYVQGPFVPSNMFTGGMSLTCTRFECQDMYKDQASIKKKQSLVVKEGYEMQTTVVWINPHNLKTKISSREQSNITVCTWFNRTTVHWIWTE